jgi:hypothetical protein
MMAFLRHNGPLITRILCASLAFGVVGFLPFCFIIAKLSKIYITERLLVSQMILKCCICILTVKLDVLNK